MSHKISYYDWIPDLLDHRDFLRAAPPTILGSRLQSLTSACNVHRFMFMIQGQPGSCTATAIADAFQIEHMKQQLAQIFSLSWLFIYYNVICITRVLPVISRQPDSFSEYSPQP